MKGKQTSEKELIENLVYPDTMYKKQIQELEQQLQAYKDKLDKLKYLIKEYRNYEEEYIHLDYVEEILNDKVVE